MGMQAWPISLVPFASEILRSRCSERRDEASVRRRIGKEEGASVKWLIEAVEEPRCTALHFMVEGANRPGMTWSG